MAVHDAGSTGKKRKKMSEERVAEEVEFEVEEQEEESEGEEQEEEEEESEGEEEERIEEGGDFDASNGSQTVLRIDTNVLDCSICCEPFRPPIYQCQNGHAYCSPCCSSLSGKCPVCSQVIGLIRNLALERVVESAQISCINARYGCNTTLSYLQRDTHHKLCNYRPCTCPVPACAFKGSSVSLSDHFRSHHGNSAVKFSYGKCCHVALSRTENPFVVLLGLDGRLFLLLNNNDTTRGSALSMICIASRNEKTNYDYAISVGLTITLKLKAFVQSTTEWEGVYPTHAFLFVPNDFSSDRLVVGVNIKKCKPL